MLFLLAAPALAHPGHVSLQLSALDRDVSVNLTVPSSVLAVADMDGDFRITPAEVQQHRAEVLRLLREQVRFSSSGLPLRPELVSVTQPPVSGERASRLEAAETPVALGLRYRAPWKVTDLRLEFGMFGADETPECNVRIEGFGPTRFQKLVPGSHRLTLGQPGGGGRLVGAGLMRFFTAVWPPVLLVAILLLPRRRYRFAGLLGLIGLLGLLGPTPPAYLVGQLIPAGLGFLRR